MSWKTVASFVPVSLPRQCGKHKPSLLWYRYSGNEMLHSRCCFGPTAHCMQVNCKHPHFITLQPSQTLAKIPWVMDRGRCQRTVFQMIHSRDWNDQEAWGLGELSLFHGQGVQHWSLGSGRLSRVHKHRESFQFEVLYKESLVQTKRQVKLRKASQPWLPDCVCHRLLSASLPQSKEPPGPNPGIQDRLYPPYAKLGQHTAKSSGALLPRVGWNIADQKSLFQLKWCQDVDRNPSVSGVLLISCAFKAFKSIDNRDSLYPANHLS